MSAAGNAFEIADYLQALAEPVPAPQARRSSRLSRRHAHRVLPLVPLVYRLISLAGPGPSGSTKPSRLCQRCFPPSPASPGSGCAQLLPGCCDSLARRSRTSFDSQRLTAHRRLVAHMSSSTGTWQW